MVGHFSFMQLSAGSLQHRLTLWQLGFGASHLIKTHIFCCCQFHSDSWEVVGGWRVGGRQTSNAQQGKGGIQCRHILLTSCLWHWSPNQNTHFLLLSILHCQVGGSWGVWVGGVGVGRQEVVGGCGWGVGGGETNFKCTARRGLYSVPSHSSNLALV